MSAWIIIFLIFILVLAALYWFRRNADADFDQADYLRAQLDANSGFYVGAHSSYMIFPLCCEECKKSAFQAIATQGPETKHFTTSLVPLAGRDIIKKAPNYMVIEKRS